MSSINTRARRSAGRSVRLSTRSDPKEALTAPVVLAAPIIDECYGGLEQLRDNLRVFLRKSREEAGYSQTALRKLTEVPQSVAAVESGRASLTVRYFNAVSIALGLSLSRAIPDTSLTKEQKTRFHTQMCQNLGGVAINGSRLNMDSDALLQLYLRLAAIDELAAAE